MANLFIVGAMKAGTTAFTNAIAHHPHVCFSTIKEPNYFVDNLPNTIYTPSKFFSLKEYFDKEFPKPLHIAHITDEAQYNKLFSNCLPHHKYLADGSTAYLHADESAEKIYTYNKNAKIIILLRNGLKRALSHYKMDAGLGRITKSFEAVLEENLNAYKKKQLSNWSYLGMSLYANNVCRFKRIYKENVLIVEFEDLISKQEEIFRNVFSFLELDNYFVELNQTNESINTRFNKGLHLFYKSGVKDLFSSILPVQIRHAVFNLLKRNSSSNIEITSKLRNELLCLFQEDILKIKEQC